jgi:hypothetical protein
MARYSYQLFILTLLVIIVTGGCKRDKRACPDFNFSFEDDKELELIEWQCKELFVLSDSFAVDGNKSLKVTFYPAKYANIIFKRFNKNWRSYNNLYFHIYNPQQDSLFIIVKIKDMEINPPYKNRYNNKFLLKPGMNKLHIPFSQLKTSITERALNLDNIKGVVLFLMNVKEPVTLYFDRFYLQ